MAKRDAALWAPPGLSRCEVEGEACCGAEIEPVVTRKYSERELAVPGT